MNRIIGISLLSFLLAGCSGILEKQEPVCQGTALIGGQETTVQIYGVRKVADQTQFKAGDPFGWRWVGVNNFSNNNCSM